ncbi:hypothetical protein BV509_10070 [Rhodovulum sulfidophilum]|uniref:Cytochrome c domain-containing protein n=1 Tax=Rhodovulum visakhapatnamense TaxID=364297 RepID=A0ABS1RK59_9RHOB|nr:di-heme-cytochrome C peroxidase [Rhodovulum visakhapatnamense]MBL3570993.1 hypothetical protein [Rhodovulum visakhapatnamense]MBL3580038.1 hypothetical protein [Rhodovulum visakhapatnamense]OLS44651.1 hypothetical protein BV509_10070 [Rhodovulum sulfidophilum]
MLARSVFSAFLLSVAAPLGAQTVYVDQGDSWTGALRSAFYTQDQGSRIMPLAWMQALTGPDGTPFLADSLARYGYLPMPDRDDDATLPVGFTTNESADGTAIGMTCAACHTRQIEVGGTAYRIDGGPAIVDFQSFLADLDAAVLAVLADGAAFDAFADKVAGGDGDRADLRAELETWSKRFHTLIAGSLPDPAWGPARLDAVSMIFNRLTGLDLGAPEDAYLIPENILIADAPTRYPFLWNAARQDMTQWPGFAENGNDLLGLARNLGEVYGVFGEFHPTAKPGLLFDRDYVTDNSANWEGLKSLEDAIWKIGAPRWPWALDEELAEEGRTVFDRATDQGGCVECHGKKQGAFRSIFHSTWATPILPAGTDERECEILTRTAKTGVLEGAKVPLSGKTLGAEAAAFDLLGLSVIGAIIQHATGFRATSDLASAAHADLATDEDFMGRFDDLRGAFPSSGPDGVTLETAAPACAYESRVLDGIWAAAPYLHNGSVPTLRDLLTPPAERTAAFMPGPAYDIDAVGMAAGQTAFDHVIETTGCDQISSGNSRCGHDYGTALSEADKRALLEYLKSI